MNSQEFHSFTETLTANLKQNDKVIALIALGSMAQQDYQPDRWSDHDFFVMVETGEQEGFRQKLEWLPNFADIVMAYRETQHGLKIVYKSGHLLEFAIFDSEELNLAKVNRYRVLFDKTAPSFFNRLEAIRTSSAQASPVLDVKEFSEFLTNLLVGVGRYSRGERFSGRHFVKTYAFGHLLALLKKHIPAPNASLLDNLDPLRRFERVYPELGAELNEILDKPTPQSALALLDFAEREFAGCLEDYPAAAVAVIREQIKV